MGKRKERGRKKQTEEGVVREFCLKFLPATLVVVIGMVWLLAGKSSEAVDRVKAKDVDRVNPILKGVSPNGDSVTDEKGRAIAKALDLQKWMDDIVATTPGAEMVCDDPPIIHFKNFMSEKEANAMIKVGTPGLEASTGTGELKDGKFERTTIQGRTSYNSWCMNGCDKSPIARKIDNRIANVTGFSVQNQEYYQILRYETGQEYQAHSDWIEQQKYQPSGPRMFTFFLYLNEVEEGGGGSTWFPQATTNVTTPADTFSVHSYYDEYNQVAAREAGALSPSAKFKANGFRARPQLGSAIMWPNADLDNVYRQHPKTLHAAEPLQPGHTKWSANAWIHLRDFRTPHATGKTG